MQHTWERARWGRGTCGRGSPGPRKPATDPRGLPSPPAPQGRGARKRPLLARRAGPAPPRPSQLGRAAPPLALTDGWEQRCRFWAEPEESRWDSYVLLSPPWQLGSLCNMAEPRKAAARPSRGRRTATWRATRHTAASALGEAAEIWGLSLRPARGLHRWGGVGGLAMTSALPPGPCAGRGARPPLPGPPRVSHCVTPDKPLGPSDPHLPYLPSRVYMVVGGGSPSGVGRATGHCLFLCQVTLSTCASIPASFCRLRLLRAPGRLLLAWSRALVPSGCHRGREPTSCPKSRKAVLPGLAALGLRARARAHSR